MQKTWVGFKINFRTAHRELQETKYLAFQDAGMNQTNMVSDVVAVLQEVLQHENVPIKSPVAIQ